MNARWHILIRLLLAGALTVACTMSLLGTPAPPSVPAPWTASPTTVAAPTTGVPSPVPSKVTETPALGPTIPIAFCDDDRPRQLITQFEAAIRNSDGNLLASLVSPQHGMEARLFRDGRGVNYDREHAAALFDSSYALNWGIAPGSGLETVGSFRDLVVPDLLDVLARDYQLTCNEVRVGGTTYAATWAYPDIDFYSLYFPGTPANGGLDWHSWLLGMHHVGGQPYLYAIMQFEWEP